MKDVVLVYGGGIKIIYFIDAAKKKKPHLKLQCKDCKGINYFTHKTKKMVDEKLELNKFCKSCKKHTLHKEMKK